MTRRFVSWSALASALAFFLVGLFPLFASDAYGHLAQGRQIVALGRVPKADLFSFWQPTPQPWNNYEWAYDLLTWLLYDHFGANALILLKCLLLAALGYLLVLLGSRLARGADLAAPLTLAALLFALPVARFRFTMRPQIVGLLFPSILLLGIGVLYDEETSSRRKGAVLAGLASMHLVWVNAHGSHLLGAAITLIFAVFSFRTAAFRWMLGLLSLQLLTSGCTPFGFAIVTDAASHVFRPEYRQLVVEWAAWAPKDPLRLLVAPTVTALLVIAAMRPVTGASRFGLAYAVLCVLLSIMAFRSMRFVAHQLLLCAPFIAAGFSQRPRFASKHAAVLGLVGVAAVSSTLWIIQMVPDLGFGFGEPKRGHPWASAELIENEVEGARILATIEDSWVLMFAAPRGKLLVDGRVPFYGPEMIQRVGRSFGNPQLLEQLLREYDVNTVVIDNTRSDQASAMDYLSTQSAWALGFVEDGHTLFIRRDAAPGLAPFEIVGPGYRVGRLLDRDIPDAVASSEVSRIGSQLNTTSIHGWHQGLELLRPLARDGDRAGVRRYRSREEQVRARAAYERLSVPATSFPGFTSIELYRAMAALSACDVTEARRALGRAVYVRETRETSLVALELSLRAGQPPERSAAVAHLERLNANPLGRSDPWVAAITADMDVRCPTP